MRPPRRRRIRFHKRQARRNNSAARERLRAAIRMGGPGTLRKARQADQAITPDKAAARSGPCRLALA
ncbi:hypothetical protein MesoLjLb_54870 [Mesorhizobium sp. L-8-3]|nr:hypothetical protein MesoLjLb_54870 [Mesorhizobium sp. L-8-3]